MDFEQNRELSIHTPLGQDVFLIRDFYYQDELGQPFEIQTVLFSLKENIQFESLLGQAVHIEMQLEQEQKRYFHGHITQLIQRQNQGPFAVYEATITPWLWFLTRTADCRIFQNLSVPDIIKQVFRDLGFTDFKDELSGDYPIEEYRVQYRETDFQFVHRLMEEVGIYYYFEHHQNKHILVMVDFHASHPMLSPDTLPYHQEDSSYVGKKMHIYQWLLQKTIQPGRWVLNDFDFKKPRANLSVEAARSREYDKSDYEIYDYPGKYTETRIGEELADTRLDERQAQYESFNAASNVRSIATGYLFSLKDHPRQDQNQSYLITACQHWASNDIYYSGQSYSEYQYDNQFNAICSIQEYKPPRRTLKPTVQGPQTAIVVGPKGEEIYTDQYGRVKVQFHWDRYGKSDENSSCWVRVSQVWAGKHWGAIHIPRIGQEVIIDFLEGDPDRPIITGRVYNAEQMPPYDLPANKTQSGIKSRSSQKGSVANFNEIRFEDKKGQEELYIHAEKNQTNIVENDEYTEIGHDRTELVQHDETITIKHDRTETVKNNENITIEGQRDETVFKNESVTVQGNRNHTVIQDDTLSVIGNQTNTIGANQNNMVTGNQTDTVNGSYAQTVAGGIIVTTPAMINYTAVGGMTVVAPGGYKVIAPGGTTVIDSFFNKLGGILNESYGFKKVFSPLKAEIIDFTFGATNFKAEINNIAMAETLVKMERTELEMVNEATELKQVLADIKNIVIKIIQ